MKRIRTSFSGGGDWAGLPGHLLNLILQHFERASSNANTFVENLLPLRLVCKAWRDACSEFSGRGRISTTEDSDLEQLCKLLPRLSELALTNHATDFSLSPLSALTRLSVLKLDHYTYEEDREDYGEDEMPSPVLDLAPLPASLQTLHLFDVSVDPSCHQHLKCTGLTSLLYIWTNPKTPEAIDLLRYLPELQDLCVGYYLSDGNGVMRDPELSSVFRCPAVTRLELKLGSLVNPSQMPADGSVLKELELFSLDMSWEWIQKMSTTLTALTSLSFDRCYFGGDSAPNLQALSSLRSLIWQDTSAGVLSLAGPNVKELRLRSSMITTREEVDISRFATLTGLTKLSLSSVSSSTDAKPLQKLGLRELSLDYCPDIAEALIVPGALTALQTLRLDEFSRKKIGNNFGTSNMARLLSENLGPENYSAWSQGSY